MVEYKPRKEKIGPDIVPRDNGSGVKYQAKEPRREQIKRWIKKYRIWILIIIVMAGLFYWYEIRPIRIRKYCTGYTNYEKLRGESISTAKEYYNLYYQDCLHRHGL